MLQVLFCGIHGNGVGVCRRFKLLQCCVMSSLAVSELLEFTQCHYWSLCSDQKALQGY